MRVAVLGAGGPSGVNWCRALAFAGHDVVAVDATESHLEWCLSYADEAVHAPELTADVVNRLGADVVHACPDPLVHWLAVQVVRGEIEAATLLPSLPVVERCQFKREAIDCWSTNGLRSPALDVGDPLPDMLHLAADRFGTPFWLRASHGAGARGATVVEDLRTGYHWIRYWQTRGADISWIAEEYLPGRDYAWTGIYDRGELIMSFARERLEYIYPELSPSGLTGTPTIARVIHDADVNAAARSAVAAIDTTPHGLYAVDLREDRNGVPRPTEINPGRGGTTTGLWSCEGANFADVHARLALRQRDAGWPEPENALPDGLELRRHIDCDPVVIGRPTCATF